MFESLMGDVDDLVVKGDKKYNSYNFLDKLFNDLTKYEDALEFYERAANKYKLHGKYKKASDIFIKCANCYKKLNDLKSVSENYLLAANCLSEISVVDSIDYYENGINLLAELGCFKEIVKYREEIASLYEKELEIDDAIKHYKLALDIYECENFSKYKNNACRIKISKLFATNKNYMDAIKYFEESIKFNLTGSSIFNANKCFYEMSLCYLCNDDLVGLKRAIEKYTEENPNFLNKQQYRFIGNLSGAIENMDDDKFQEAVDDYCKDCKIDSWEISQLLVIKKIIENNKNLIQSGE